MKKTALLLLLLFGFSQASDITLLSDSLWVYNNHILSRDGFFSCTNTTTQTLSLDSIRVQFDAIVFKYPLPDSDRLEILWRGSTAQPDAQYTWRLKMVTTATYTLQSWQSASGAVPEEIRSYEPGETFSIRHFQIGRCFVCSSLPEYPLYVSGKLILYFSNNNTITVQLYSDDYRTKSTVSPSIRQRSSTSPSTDNRYLLNGRKVENSNVNKRAAIRFRVLQQRTIP